MAAKDFSFFPDVDLFGEPIAPLLKRGRPRYEPTARERARVRRLRKAGRTHDQIAQALGITGPTLRMNFREELQSASTVRARRDRLDKAKEKSNGNEG